MARGRDLPLVTLLPIAAVAVLLAASTPFGAVAIHAPTGPAPTRGSSVVDVGSRALAAARASIALGGGPGATPLVTGRWTVLAPELVTNAGYPGEAPAMAYDAADGYVLVLGGFVGHNSSLPTWIFVHGRWTQVPSPGPPSDQYSAIAYDAADREVVLFGGADFSNPHTIGNNDTWVYRAGNWTRLPANTTHAPSGRFQASLAYDGADGYLLLWGGKNERCVNGPPCRATLHADTWKFRGGVWTLLVGHPGVHPSADPGALMAYDAPLGRVVLIGGIIHMTYNPTWTFRSGNWSALNVTPPRGDNDGRLNSNFGACLVYDPALGKLLLFRGNTNAQTPGPTQTYVFNGTWHVVRVTAAPPRSDTSNCVYDPGLGTAVIFGAPMWEFAGTTWRTLPLGPQPPADPLTLLAYDARDGYIVYFGSTLAQTWEYVHQNWTDVTNGSRPNPPPTAGPAMTYDAADGYVLLFLGSPNETWSFHAGHWTHRVTAVAPSPRANPALSYDSADGYVVLFGGAVCVFGQCRDPHDTWKYLAGNWSLIPPAKGGPPPGRNLAGFVDDRADGYLVLFGGTRCNSTAHACWSLNDTWTFAHGSWSNRTSAASPGARTGAVVAYDGHAGVVALFGGCTGTSNGGWGSALSDTWVFSGGVWASVPVFAAMSPPARCHAPMTYDSATGRDLLASGDGFSDLWSLRLT
ncbi:MAG TPA: hypothetical protein VGV89_09515 [Thermoplasmata archaeon]|nr:hypothetical protein [Thermoplasmata archaeon]